MGLAVGDSLNFLINKEISLLANTAISSEVIERIGRASNTFSLNFNVSKFTETAICEGILMESTGRRYEGVTGQSDWVVDLHESAGSAVGALGSVDSSCETEITLSTNAFL